MNLVLTLTWDGANKKLTIYDRKGSFPGMLSERKFNIVVVGKTKGVGITPVEKFDQVVTYDGKKVVVKL